ncbi:agmatinase [Pseudohyphozyma bogoriensis]|nr:agmatinase [Pseudohyphozyma bogoriensis]
MVTAPEHEVKASSAAQPDAIAFDFGPPPPTFEDKLEERKYIKERLALSYRVFAKLGLMEGAAGHLTVRDPIMPDCFWVTPFGKQFALMSASDLLLINHDGKIVMGGKPERQFYNAAAFIIHAEIHKARPNANAVCHSHSPYGKAWSILRKPLPIYTQDACIFHNDLALYDMFGGVVLDSTESKRICKAIGDKKAVILCNHGLLTVGETIESATAWFIALENECRTAITALSTLKEGDEPLKEIEPEAAQFTYDNSGFERAGWFEALPWFELCEFEGKAAHIEGHDHTHDDAWSARYGPVGDLSFSGITTFAHLPHHKCLDGIKEGGEFDIAVLGAPFDTSVSFRPGARFGPYGIRSGSRRHAPNRGYSMPWGFNPFQLGTKIVDCGDIPVSPYDNALALEQIQVAYSTLLARKVSSEGLDVVKGLAKDGKEHARIVTLGGDHTILLPILRALKDVYGPISVIHFDAHIDTWNGDTYAGAFSDQSKITHGSFFWKASQEGLITNTSSIHAGIRTRLSDVEDLEHDASVGFQLLTTDDIDEMRPSGIVKAIKERVGNTPVYLSFDIDTIDPSMAPATGTPETGGWTTREVKKILRGLSGPELNIVGMDVVEVSPAYDTNAELTGLAAADLVQEFLALLSKKSAKKVMSGGKFTEGEKVVRGRDEL